MIDNAWYRLRTVDVDGKSRYSNVIRIANTTRTIRNPSTGLAKGVYVLQLTAGNEVVWTQRI